MLINPIINFNINSIKKAQIKAPISPVKLHLKPQLQKDTISFSGNKKQTSQTYEQKRQYIIDKGKLAFRPKMLDGKDEAFLDRAIAIIEKESDVENAVIIAGYEEKQYKRALELVDKDIVPYSAKKIALLDDRTYEKTLLLINKKVEASDAQDIGELEDKEYARTLILMKKGMSAQNAYGCASFDDETYQKALDLLAMGVDSSFVRMISGLNDAVYKEIVSMIKKGVSPYDAIKVYRQENIRKNYDNFKDWLGDSSASIVAGFEFLELLNFGQIKSLANVAQTIKKNSKKSTRLSEQLSKFFERNNLDDINIGEFSEYLSKIDFKKLKQLAPSIKNYTSEELLIFLGWYFETNTTDFSKEDLTFSTNLTEYLRENHTTAEQLNKILVACPLTKREVGEVPSDWLNKTKDKEKATKEIYKAITKFTNNPKPEELEKALSAALNKQTKVELLGKGNYAKVFKLSIDEAMPTCLKIFPASKNTYNISYHGRNTEVQLGLFLNQHSEDFVKMHFGKVCDSKRRDGFLVTQFLDEHTIPIMSEDIDDKSYKIEYYDNHKRNYIQGKIIDYGGVGITKLSSFPSCFNFF